MTRKDDEFPPEVVDRIAERAAELALEKVYAEVGRSVLRRAAWLAGLIVVGLALWLTGKGQLPTGGG
jgi:hypothetical protein